VGASTQTQARRNSRLEQLSAQAAKCFPRPAAPPVRRTFPRPHEAKCRTRAFAAG
jgi:hypothetical protein